MKVKRREIRILIRDVIGDAQNEGNISERHNCAKYTDPNLPFCFMCWLIRNNSNFELALVYFLRKEGILPQIFLNSEYKIIDLVGKDRYEKILNTQLEDLKNIPYTKCNLCNHFTILGDHQKRRLILLLSRGVGAIDITCCNSMCRKKIKFDIKQYLSEKV